MVKASTILGSTGVISDTPIVPASVTANINFRFRSEKISLRVNIFDSDIGSKVIDLDQARQEVFGIVIPMDKLIDLIAVADGEVRRYIICEEV